MFSVEQEVLGRADIAVARLDLTTLKTANGEQHGPFPPGSVGGALVLREPGPPLGYALRFVSARYSRKPFSPRGVVQRWFQAKAGRRTGARNFRIGRSTVTCQTRST